MDIVKFCEKVLNIQLLDFQKKLLIDMYEAGIQEARNRLEKAFN